MTRRRSDGDDSVRLTRIEERLELLVKALDRDLPDWESRLNKVERFMWIALGMSVASGVPQIVQLLGS